MSQVPTEKLPIRIRAATEEDTSFIFNSWLKSFRDSAFAKQITNTIYFAQQHKLIEDLLKSCQVFVACSASNPGELYGYICCEQVDGIYVFHYVYVKHTYRKLGIAKMLAYHTDFCEEMASMYTHAAKNSEYLAGRFKVIYCPYIAFLQQYRVKKKERKKRVRKS